MTRSELIERLAVERGVPFNVAEKVVETMFGYMTETLVTGGRIEVRGFGSFEIREYVGRIARNPKTGVQLEIMPKKAPFFKAGKELKERVAGI